MILHTDKSYKIISKTELKWINMSRLEKYKILLKIDSNHRYNHDLRSTCPIHTMPDSLKDSIKLYLKTGLIKPISVNLCYSCGEDAIYRHNSTKYFCERHKCEFCIPV